MNEYNVSLTAPDSGGVLLDVHSTTGTSRYATFESGKDLRSFLSSVGLVEEKLAEFDKICSNLRLGEAYHETMPLSEQVIHAIQTLAIQHV